LIDLHCHILPGIDDGAQTIDDSIELAKAAVDEGITHILATPHHRSHSWINEKHKVQTLVDEVQNEIDQQDIPLTLFPGQEVRIHGDILENIDKNEIQLIDEQEQYVLIEFPTSTVPTYTERLFFDMQSNGITPIIVHPERNHAIAEEPDILKNLVEKGALAQLTAVSYTGGLGNKIQKLSKQLIDAKLVHFIASDAHNTSSRPFYMKEAMNLLEKEYGKTKVSEYHEVTRQLVNGDVVITPTPEKIKRKRFFGLF